MPWEFFTPGVDPGLKLWLQMRQEVRESRLKHAGASETIPSGFKYKSQTQWNTDLMACVKTRSLQTPKPINKNVVQLHQFNEMLRTNKSVIPPELILSTAIYQNHVRFLQTVIALKYDLNLRIDHLGRTMLHVAVFIGDITKVTLLLQHGANPNIQDFNKCTPLVLSICPAHPVFHPVAITQALLNRGAMVNTLERHNRSALHFACIVDNIEAMNMLITAHADISILDVKEKMAIDFTRKETTEEFLRTATKYSKPSQFKKMVARILSRSFVSLVFNIVEMPCEVCKRKTKDCAALKKNDYRYWMYAHKKLEKESQKLIPGGVKAQSRAGTNSISMKGRAMEDEESNSRKKK